MAPTSTATAPRPEQGGRRGGALVGVAAAFGLVHAAASFWWALGGDWLLDTVGRGTVALRRERPLVAVLILLAVGGLKVAAAVLPALNAAGRLSRPRLWRTVSWAGAVLLVAYGAANTVGAWLGLTGVVDVPADYDRRGAWGHAALWDPLFLLWGAALLAHLVRSRRA